MSGQVYVANSIIEGDVDFIWGNGVVYFDHCEIKDVTRKGYNVQARNAAGAMGYVFVDCNLTADASVTGGTCWRAPTRTTRSPGSMVAYIDCTHGPAHRSGRLADRRLFAAALADAGVAGRRRGLEPHQPPLLGVPQRRSGGRAHRRQPAHPGVEAALRREAAQLRDAYVFGGWNPKAAVTCDPARSDAPD